MRYYDLNVNGEIKKITKLNYDDLVWLFNDYINKYNRVPTQDICCIKNNLPHGKAIKKILNDNNVTYNDFLNQFGKYSHVRTESKDYEMFLNRYKQISKSIGHGLCIEELKNNLYGLPSASWFVKYCPDDNVKCFDDFVQWAGFESNKLKIDKEKVIRKIKEYEKKLGRPITRNDIKKSTLGFSMIVINRIWGGLGQCKKELGLLPTPLSHPKPFEYYKNIIDQFVSTLNDKLFVTWKEIEDYTTIDHKTFIKSFNDSGLDIYKYFSELNICLNPNSYGHSTILPSGEKVLSSYEYIFSKYLNNQGYIYGKDYIRDVSYKTFLSLPNNSRINCDYVVKNNYYIEIAGIISNKNNDWDTREYKYKTHIKYQQKMLNKKYLLENNNKNYLFLFPEDFNDDQYKNKFMQFINSGRIDNVA